MAENEINPDSSSSDSSPPADSHISTAQSITYWNNVESSVSGMLGGYPQVSRIDLQGSRNFLAKLRRMKSNSSKVSSTSTSTSANTKLSLVADCGAGIGRITTSFLSQISTKVDIVEPVAKFTDALASNPTLTSQNALGDIYNVGLEAWSPPAHKKYDLIWNQWCLGHLTDAQLVSYLGRVSRSLAHGGWLVVKENLSSSKRTNRFSPASDGDGDDIYDDEDSSVTRSDAKFLALFDRAGLLVVRAELQTGFPKDLGLFPVKMYALRPREDRRPEEH